MALVAITVLAHETHARGARCPLEVEQRPLVFERVRRVGGGEVPVAVDAYWRGANVELRAHEDGVTLAIDPEGEPSDEAQFVLP